MIIIKCATEGCQEYVERKNKVIIARCFKCKQLAKKYRNIKKGWTKKERVVKWCERCGKVKIDRNKRYCGSWREKSGCSYIATLERNRLASRKRRASLLQASS